MPDQVVLVRIRGIVDRVATSERMEVVDVELRKGPRSLLRIFIDKPGGVTHRDCELISKQVGAILDVEDLIPTSYTLQVSSPGVEPASPTPCRPAMERQGACHGQPYVLQLAVATLTVCLAVR